MTAPGSCAGAVAVHNSLAPLQQYATMKALFASPFFMADKNKVGLVVGALIGGWHVVWSLLVVTGLGQMLYDFVLWMHMIRIDILVGPFDAMASLTLIVVTAVFGYVFGYVGAWVWNRVYGSAMM